MSSTQNSKRRTEIVVDDPRLGKGPVRIQLQVAWGEMDALGHVNNTVYLRWFENARIAYLRHTEVLDSMRRMELAPILAHQTIDYLLPVTHPDTVEVATTVTSIGNTSFTMAFRINSMRHGALAAEGSGRLVMVDIQRKCKVPVDAKLRQLIYDIEGGRKL
jgi:acyl-CoA thioester hydrolase